MFYRAGPALLAIPLRGGHEGAEILHFNAVVQGIELHQSIGRGVVAVARLTVWRSATCERISVSEERKRAGACDGEVEAIARIAHCPDRAAPDAEHLRVPQRKRPIRRRVRKEETPAQCLLADDDNDA